jgi:hypothetical protein
MPDLVTADSPSPARHVTTRAGFAAGLVLVLAVAVAISWSRWGGPPRWSPDGLYYEAQRLELQGASAQRARNLVFFESPRYRSARVEAFRIERDPAYARRIWTRRWVEYSARFYRRRWSNSIAAAATSGWFGVRSLMVVSLAGYVAIGLMLYVLLSIRFGWRIGAGVAASALTLDPVRLHSFIALTDSWGVALLALSLAIAYRFVVGSARWLAAFVPLVTVLAFTRDNWIVLVVAGVVLALYGHRRGWVISGAGAAAALPAVILFAAPVREELAYTLNRYQPTSAGWGFIARKYPWTLVHSELVNGLYVLRHPFTGAFFLLGLIVVLVGYRSSDAYLQVMVAAIVGGIAYLLINPNWDATRFRFELVLLPPVAPASPSPPRRVSSRSLV